MTKPAAKDFIMQVPLYVAGAHDTDGGIPPAVLSANENPLGCSDQAITALQLAAKSANRYPDSSAHDLKQALAKTYRLNEEQIICTAGSDELIGLICRGFVGAGDEVLMSAYGFLMYEISAKLCGATIVKAAERNYCTDVDQLLKAVTQRTKILFLANPNNPTASYLKKDELLRLVQNLPKHILLVLDAAYCEFVEDIDFESGMGLVDQYENIIVTRTFSKIYGLAGLRLGWGYGHKDIINVLHRIRGPFNTSYHAQKTGIAALEDQGFLEKTRQHNLIERQRIKTEINQMSHNLGWKIYPSVTNFLMVSFKDSAQADAVNQFLLSKGVIIRSLKAYQLANCLRITIGLRDENTRLLEALKDYVHNFQPIA